MQNFFRRLLTCSNADDLSVNFQKRDTIIMGPRICF